MRLFLTGDSSGLGLALAREALQREHQVWGLSRRGCPLVHPQLQSRKVDLANSQSLANGLEHLLAGVDRLGTLILNAGLLGEIRAMTETPLADIRSVMAVNVWANKLILDWFHQRGVLFEQAVFISSGAAVNGHAGWGAYALSKATLNMLVQLYAHEFPHAHLIALAPGLVDTPMQDHLCESVDTKAFPSVQRLVDARGTEQMPAPEQVAIRILELLPQLKCFDSGSFVDLRDLS